MLIVYRNIFIFSLFNQQHSNPKIKRNCAFLQSRDLTADGRRNVCRYSSNVVVRIVRSNNFQRPNLFFIQYRMSLNLCGDSEVDMQNVHFIVSLTTVAMLHRKQYPAGHSVTAAVFRGTINGTFYVTQAKGRNDDFNKHSTGIWTRLEMGTKIICSCDGLLFFKDRLIMYVACVGENGSACEILVAKPEGRRSFWSLRHDGRILLKLDIKTVWW